MTDFAGRRGRLLLTFDKNDRTVILRQFAQAPFHVQRAMYFEDALPEMAFVYIMSSSGGILGGDSHHAEIILKENAMVHVTTQGATRVYDSAGRKAIQDTCLKLGPSSYLEFIPDQIIPYANSRYIQKTKIIAHDTSVLVYAEILTSGRLAMGESYQYDTCLLQTSATDQNGRYRFIDTSLIEPKNHMVCNYGVMGGHTVVGSVYVLAPKPLIIPLYNNLNTLAQSTEGVEGGASIMHNQSGVIVRLLGGATFNIMNAVWKIAAGVRRLALRAPFTIPRKT